MGEPMSRVFALGLALLVPIFAGCATVVVPPRLTGGGVAVFLLDHGHHSSLVLPAPGRHLVRYSYGDWAYYALVETGVYRGSSALFWPTQAALGRRELPGPPTASAVEEEVAVPIEHLYPVIVAPARIDALRQRLDRVFEANAGTMIYNSLYDLYFVQAPQPYSLFHDSNREVASWLVELGCRVEGGPALLSNWAVEPGAGP